MRKHTKKEGQHHVKQMRGSVCLSHLIYLFVVVNKRVCVQIYWCNKNR